MRVTLPTLIAIILTWSIPAGATNPEPPRLQVLEHIVIQTPAKAVWDILGKFGACQEWHPEIVHCPIEGGPLPGAIRTMMLNNGASISEKLIMYNDRKRELMYRITSMSHVQLKQGSNKPYAVPALPVRQYHAWLRVNSLPDGSSRVSWEAHFLPAYEGKGKAPPELDSLAAKSQVQAFLKAGLTGLKKRLEP